MYISIYCFHQVIHLANTFMTLLAQEAVNNICQLFHECSALLRVQVRPFSNSNSHNLYRDSHIVVNVIKGLMLIEYVQFLGAKKQKSEYCVCFF